MVERDDRFDDVPIASDDDEPRFDGLGVEVFEVNWEWQCQPGPTRPHDFFDRDVSEVEDVVEHLSFVGNDLGGPSRVFDGLLEVVGFECRFDGHMWPEDSMQEPGRRHEDSGDRIEESDADGQWPGEPGGESVAEDDGEAFGENLTEENDPEQADEWNRGCDG